jgi:PAS domain S-box-containing protein
MSEQKAAGGPEDRETIRQHCTFMADALPCLTWVLDERGGFEHVNRRMLDYTGRTLEQMLADGWGEIVHADDRQAFAATMAQRIKAGEPCEAELRLKQGSDGSYRYHTITAAPVRDGAQRVVRWFGTGTDIEKRKVEEAAMRESESRFRLLTETSNDGAFYWNCVTEDVYWTDRQLELLGLKRSEWAPGWETFGALVHPDDRELVAAKVKGHLERREPYVYELRLRHSSGEYRTVMVRGQAEWDEAGVPLRMGGGLTDITDRRRMEEDLRDKIAIIERQQEAIRQLSSPIIEVWEGVLTMPVLGTLDSQRAAQMMETLLQEVVRTRSRYTIIDLTGVDSVDTGTADHIIKLIQAVQLLGAHGIIVGIRPDVARTVVLLGVDLARITIRANLREALVFCMQGGGHEVSRPGHQSTHSR